MGLVLLTVPTMFIIMKGAGKQSGLKLGVADKRVTNRHDFKIYSPSRHLLHHSLYNSQKVKTTSEVLQGIRVSLEISKSPFSTKNSIDPCNRHIEIS